MADFEKRFAGGPHDSRPVAIAGEGAGITVLFGPSGCGKTTILQRACWLGAAGARAASRSREELWFDAARRISLVTATARRRLLVSALRVYFRI